MPATQVEVLALASLLAGGCDRMARPPRQGGGPSPAGIRELADLSSSGPKDLYGVGGASFLDGFSPLFVDEGTTRPGGTGPRGGSPTWRVPRGRGSWGRPGHGPGFEAGFEDHARGHGRGLGRRFRHRHPRGGSRAGSSIRALQRRRGSGPTDRNLSFCPPDHKASGGEGPALGELGDFFLTCSGSEVSAGRIFVDGDDGFADIKHARGGSDSDGPRCLRPQLHRRTAPATNSNHHVVLASAAAGGQRWRFEPASWPGGVSMKVIRRRSLTTWYAPWWGRGLPPACTGANDGEAGCGHARTREELVSCVVGA